MGIIKPLIIGTISGVCIAAAASRLKNLWTHYYYGSTYHNIKQWFNEDKSSHCFGIFFGSMLGTLVYLKLTDSSCRAYFGNTYDTCIYIKILD